MGHHQSRLVALLLRHQFSPKVPDQMVVRIATATPTTSARRVRQVPKESRGHPVLKDTLAKTGSQESMQKISHLNVIQLAASTVRLGHLDHQEHLDVLALEDYQDQKATTETEEETEFLEIPVNKALLDQLERSANPVLQERKDVMQNTQLDAQDPRDHVEMRVYPDHQVSMGSTDLLENLDQSALQDLLEIQDLKVPMEILVRKDPKEDQEKMLSTVRALIVLQNLRLVRVTKDFELATHKVPDIIWG